MKIINKLINILGLAMVIILFGCQQSTTTLDSTQVVEDNEIVEKQTQTSPSQKETSQDIMKDETEAKEIDAKSIDILSGDEINVLAAGFQPDTTTIKVGSTVVWMVTDNSVHLLTTKNSDLFKSPRLVSGDKFDYTFDEAGSYEIFDVIFKKSMIVNVK